MFLIPSMFIAKFTIDAIKYIRDSLFLAILTINLTFIFYVIGDKESAGPSQKDPDEVAARRRKKEVVETKSSRPVRKTRFGNQHYWKCPGCDDEDCTAYKKKEHTDVIPNEYETAESAVSMLKKKTGLVYDHYQRFHDCLWDENYIESSRRYRVIMDRCIKISHEPAKKEDILKIHSREMYEELERISSIREQDELEKIASYYDSIYFSEHTFESACIAAGCAIALVQSVGTGEIQNGMAFTRPPGHHAMFNEYCGFCYFNNVAIAAQYALDNGIAEKILIVDVDVHHGQATQQAFYRTDKVLYFSIHRYQHGEFWPNLRESDFDHIGEEKGLGYNINFPLNETGRNDSDYLSILFNILLPVAYEYNPDLIIVSGGYDACIGCPEGEMEVTPAFYGHLITLLSGLANGKIAVCLEGGYFLPSLAEGFVMTLKGLLGDPCAMLKPLTKPHESIIHTINDLRIVLNQYWKCFQMFDVHFAARHIEEFHQIEIVYKGQVLNPPYPTRNCYPVQSPEVVKKYTDMITNLKREYATTGINQVVCCCYDKAMLLHSSPENDHIEKPGRVSEIYKIYMEWKIHPRCLNLAVRTSLIFRFELISFFQPKPFDQELLKKVHDEKYLDLLKTRQLEKNNDMYSNDSTFDAVIKANECLLAVVDSVLKGKSRSGAAIIRPPGHHAEVDAALGFCFINNVAVAATYILKEYPIKRILILDFDVHHGNGTQSIFYNNNQVMYLSIHKYAPKSFFPHSTDGHSSKCGEGDCAGYNVNIPLEGKHLSDNDYLTTFFNLVLPIVYSFAPEVVLVSAGFDAGINDPIGRYCVTPECFGHFIQLIKPVAKGRLILALEGGYNLATVKYSMNICIKTLLGDPLPSIGDTSMIDVQTISTLKSVIEIQKQYWPALDVSRKLLNLKKP
ncbi:hypothetical protein FQR65_LT11800 [Abscondita terminalis]|nr:hypothetical protein FQR65_LT11800 [Abscondita terminalis]